MRNDTAQSGLTERLAGFRPATLADIREVAGWIKTRRDCELWAGPRIAYPLDPDLLPADIDLYSADSIAMVESNRLIGFGQVIHMEKNRAHLARIIVAPRLRGRSIGKLLVGELMARAWRHGCQRITLYVDRQNRPALSLYAGLGFERAPPPPDEQASADSLFMLCLCAVTRDRA
jgi:ribosomal protein S18 acetylase RimI-like enzyme